MIRNERTRGLFLAVLMVLAVFGGAIVVTGSAFAVDSSTDDGLTAQSNHGEVSNLSAPAEATAGDTITVTADVTNTNDTAETFEVEFVFGGDVLLNQSVMIGGGNTTEVSFNVPTSGVAPGTYTHGVQAGGGSQTADITIQQPATFEVSGLSAPATAVAGDTITVSATVSNVGDISGTTDAEFVFAGNVLLNESVTLDGGNSTDVSFDVPTSGIAAGTYTHGIQAGGSNQTAQIEISEWSLDTPDREVIRGNLAEFDVTFEDTNATGNEAYLVVGLQTDDFQTSYGYEANITIRDDPNSASRTGTVVFNTYEAGSVTGNVPPVTAEGGIEIVNIEEKANTAGVIEATTDADGNAVRDPYPVRFGTDNVSQAYTSTDVGGMDVISRETVDPTLNTWTAPASEVSDLEGATGAEIAQMAADGELTLVDEAPSEGIARSDRLTGDFDALVYQVQAPGIQGFLETRTGTTEDAMVAADALSLTQSNPFFNQAPKQLNLTNDASGLTITQAEGTDTYFIVANVDQLNLSRDTNLGTIPFGSPQVGETYDVAFSIDDRVGTLSASDDPTEFVEAGFQLDPANINNDGEFEIRIQEEFDVSGTTGLAPGTEFNIVIEDQMTPGSFMFVDNATVDENGEFSAEYAPQDIPASGSEFELQITVPDFPNAAGIREDGLFREQPTANVTINDQTRIGGDLVVIDSGDLSDGGYIAIHEGGPGGPIIGSSKLLAPGSFNNLPIALNFNDTISENSTLTAMPHFDRPNDGFFRFDGQNDSFYYLTEPVAPGDLPPEGQRTPVTDSAEITYIPQEQQEITRTIINTVEVPVDVTRTVTVPVTRTVEVPVEVTRTVIRDRTVEVTRTVTRTVEVVEEVTVTVTRTVEVVEEVTRTVEVTRTIINEQEVTRTVTIIRNVTDTNGQPGLGALVAVIALLAASLLAARRRDW